MNSDSIKIVTRIYLVDSRLILMQGEQVRVLTITDFIVKNENCNFTL